MNKTEYTLMANSLRVINSMLQSLDPDLLREFIEDSERSDLIAPYIDPTAWMRGHETLRAVIEGARLTAEHRAKLMALTAT